MGHPHRHEPEEEEPEEDSPTPKRSVYFRARDSLWFEPVIAVCILVLLLASLFAYTQNWPPIYVVESDSMQHGPDDHLGLINTGDLILAQNIPTSDIVTYEVGRRPATPRTANIGTSCSTIRMATRRSRRSSIGRSSTSTSTPARDSTRRRN